MGQQLASALPPCLLVLMMGFLGETPRDRSEDCRLLITWLLQQIQKQKKKKGYRGLMRELKANAKGIEFSNKEEDQEEEVTKFKHYVEDGTIKSLVIIKSQHPSPMNA